MHTHTHMHNTQRCSALIIQTEELEREICRVQEEALDNLQQTLTKLEEEYFRSKSMLRSARRDLHIFVQSFRESQLASAEGEQEDLDRMSNTNLVIESGLWTLIDRPDAGQDAAERASFSSATTAMQPGMTPSVSVSAMRKRSESALEDRDEQIIVRITCSHMEMSK